MGCNLYPNTNLHELNLDWIIQKLLTVVPGSKIYHGSGITGDSTTPSIFPGSEIAEARPGDYYINTSNTYSDGFVYICMTGGAPDVAEWAYVTSFKGEAGLPGNYIYTGTNVGSLEALSTPQVFPQSGVSYARIGDLYINTSNPPSAFRNIVFKCVTQGSAVVAEWVYAFSLLPIRKDRYTYQLANLDTFSSTLNVDVGEYTNTIRGAIRPVAQIDASSSWTDITEADSGVAAFPVNSVTTAFNAQGAIVQVRIASGGILQVRSPNAPISATSPYQLYWTTTV